MAQKHYNSLSSWASDAVDNGYHVRPDEDSKPEKVYTAHDGPMGKEVGRFRDGPIFRDGSLELKEDAPAGGTGVGSVSGGPISHNSFQTYDGPKTELLRKVKKLRKKSGRYPTTHRD